MEQILTTVTLDRLEAMIQGAVQKALKNNAPKPDPKPELITVQEAAKIAGVSAQTIRLRANDGTLTKFPINGRAYRVSRAQVENIWCKIPKQ